MSRLIVTNHVAADCKGTERIHQRGRLLSAEPKVTKEPSLPAVLRMTCVQKVIRDLVADGMTEAEILHAYPDLEAADIKEALQFAASQPFSPHFNSSWG
jgi:hypothetical protein